MVSIQGISGYIYSLHLPGEGLPQLSRQLTYLCSELGKLPP